MKDLVERLRIGGRTEAHWYELHLDAADAIELLTAERDELKLALAELIEQNKKLNSLVGDCTVEIVNLALESRNLKIDNDKLRGSLTELSTIIDNYPVDLLGEPDSDKIHEILKEHNIR